jgi:hypothetical protein
MTRLTDLQVKRNITLKAQKGFERAAAEAIVRGQTAEDPFTREMSKDEAQACYRFARLRAESAAKLQEQIRAEVSKPEWERTRPTCKRSGARWRKASHSIRTSATR